MAGPDGINRPALYTMNTRSKRKLRQPAQRKSSPVGNVIELPAGLEVFAWNVPTPLSVWGRAYVALQVLETGNEKLWRRVPDGWFNLTFAARHGRPATKRIIAEVQRLKKHSWPPYPRSD